MLLQPSTAVSVTLRAGGVSKLWAAATSCHTFATRVFATRRRYDYYDCIIYYYYLLLSEKKKKYLPL